jgi:hypothetical protein
MLIATYLSLAFFFVYPLFSLQLMEIRVPDSLLK